MFGQFHLQTRYGAALAVVVMLFDFFRLTPLRWPFYVALSYYARNLSRVYANSFRVLFLEPCETSVCRIFFLFTVWLLSGAIRRQKVPVTKKRAETGEQGRTGPPGTCQVGRLVRRSGGPPRQMLKEGVERRREPSGP